MTLFVYKPHVMGAEGAVTSPDVILDHAFVGGAAVPLARVTMDAWLQVMDGETAQAAYALVALGGGALLVPAVVLSGGTVSLSRQAWRLHTLDDRIGDVRLNDRPLAEVGLPGPLIAQAGGERDALPRGYVLVQPSGIESWHAILSDPGTGREIAQRDHAVPVGEDRWGDARPRPRYSVGPTQKDVTHYI